MGKRYTGLAPRRRDAEFESITINNTPAFFLSPPLSYSSPSALNTLHLPQTPARMHIAPTVSHHRAAYSIRPLTLPSTFPIPSTLSSYPISHLVYVRSKKACDPRPHASLTYPLVNPILAPIPTSLSPLQAPTTPLSSRQHDFMHAKTFHHSNSSTSYLIFPAALDKADPFTSIFQKTPRA